METAITLEEMASLRCSWPGRDRVAFVPTMGALHEGHISLVEFAKAQAARVVVSIFVNPTQFGPAEDFADYPRTLSEDVEKLKGAGVDVLFLPNGASIYPEGFDTYVEAPTLGKILCGASRDNHFRGVLTVVLKLFQIVRPDVAVFGKKDYQQLCLIRNMVRDFNLAIEVLGAPIVREDDGLAMSSRNRYLSADERVCAAEIFKALTLVKERFSAGERNPEALVAEYQKYLHQSSPGLACEYAEVRGQHALESMGEASISAPAVFLTAVRVGGTRLIDNLELEP